MMGATAFHWPSVWNGQGYSFLQVQEFIKSKGNHLAIFKEHFKVLEKAIPVRVLRKRNAERILYWKISK